MELLRQILYGLLPSVGIGYFFYRIMKLLMESDRNERAAYRRWLADHDTRTGRGDDDVPPSDAAHAPAGHGDREDENPR